MTRASEQLRLAQPTVSGQLKALEEALGEKLFERTGRRLVLTDVGRVVFRYADEIFSLGRELQDTLKGRPTGRPLRFTVGVADAVPKLVAYRLLLPALSLPEPVHVVCREDKPERLLAELSVHALDLVLSDAPVGADGQGEGLQPPARRDAGGLLRDRGARRGAPQGLPALARRGAACSCPPRAARCAARSTSGSTRRASAPGWWARSRTAALLKVFGQAGGGPLPRARRDRGRGPGPVRGEARRPGRRGQGALLRDLRGAPAQAPGGGGDLRGRARREALRPLAGARIRAKEVEPHGGERRADRRPARAGELLPRRVHREGELGSARA